MKNIIYDGEYYYLFRALSKKDVEDLENNDIGQIRTNCVRNHEKNGVWGKYNKDSGLSIEEVYDHVKIRHRYDTNCISLTRNSNVVLTYNKNDEKYAIIQVAPEELGKYFEAGDYFKEELRKRIKQATRGLTEDNPILKLLHDIDNVKTKEELTNMVNELSGKKLLRGKKYLSEDDQLAIGKILVKLSILQQEGLIGNIIKDKPNSELVKTMHNAYSSSEFIHYGSISKEKVFLCSKVFVYIFSLIQQKQGELTKELEGFTKQILALIKEGYDIKRNRKAWLTNIESSIELEKDEIDFLLKKTSSKKALQRELTFDRAYELTDGKISYRDTNMQLTSVRLLAEMKIKQKIIVKMLQTLFPKMNIEELLENTLLISPELAIRQNDKGYTISETVNILISELGYDLAQENIEKTLKKINELDTEDLVDIYENGINSQRIIQLLVVPRKSDERICMYKDVNKRVKYTAEAIIEGYDWKKIGRGLTKKEKEKLANKILKYTTKNNEILDLYMRLKKIWIQNKVLRQEEVFAVIINIAIDGKLGNVSYKDLLKSDNKSDILAVNIQNLQTTVEPIELDLLMKRGKHLRQLKQELIDLGLEEEFVEQKDIRNLYMAKKIVETYQFEGELTKEEKRVILQSVLDISSLDKGKRGSLIALKNSLERLGLIEQEIYGTIINLSVNSRVIDETGFNYSKLLISPLRVSNLYRFKKNIDTRVNKQTIQKALSRNINNQEERELKQSLIDLGINRSLIERVVSRNLYMAKRIVDGYYFEKELEPEEKRAILQSILVSKQLGQEESRDLFNIVKNFKKIGLIQQEVYGTIINLAINSNAVSEFGYHYSMLLHSPSKILELYQDIKSLNTKVKSSAIQRAVIDNMDEEDIQKIKQELIDLGIDKDFIEQKDEKNICMAKKIVDGYRFEKELEPEERRAILQSILAIYLLDKTGSCYLTNLVSNLEKIGLTEQEIYGAIINLGINSTIIQEPDYSYDSLLSSSTQVSRLAEYKNEIDSKVGPVTIQVALVNNMNHDEVEKEKQELIDLGIDKDFIEKKDIKNVCMAKRIIERYCFENRLQKKEKRAILQQMLKGLALNKEYGCYLTTLANNLEKIIELTEQEVYGTIINLGINGSVIDKDGYYYTELLHSTPRILELAKYKNEIDSKVSTITIQKAVSNCINEQESEELKQELIALGMDKEFVEKKDIRNIYIAKTIVEGYHFDRELNLEEKTAIIEAILKSNGLNKEKTSYLTALTRNFIRIGLTQQEVYGAMINLAINESIIEQTGYGYYKLITSPKKIMEMRDYKKNIDSKVRAYTVQKAVMNNINEQEVKKLKQGLIALGLDEEFVEQKDVRNLYMAKRIIEGYSFEKELTREEKRAILQSILGPKVLDKVGYLISLSGNLENIGLAEQEIYGVIINLAVNGSVTEKTGYDYSKLLGKPSKVAELTNYKIETKVSNETIKNAQEKAERIMKRALKKLKKEGKIGEIADTSKRLNDLVKMQAIQNKEFVD